MIRRADLCVAPRSPVNTGETKTTPGQTDKAAASESYSETGVEYKQPLSLASDEKTVNGSSECGAEDATPQPQEDEQEPAVIHSGSDQHSNGLDISSVADLKNGSGVVIVVEQAKVLVALLCVN